MQVGTGGPSGFAKFADDLTLHHAIAGTDGDVPHMDIKRRQAITVIDNDGTTSEVQIGLGEADDAFGGGRDRRAGGRCDIDAEMRLPRLAVEEGLAAINAGDDPGHRPFERRFEGDAIALLRERPVDFNCFAFDAYQRFRRRRDLGRR